MKAKKSAPATKKTVHAKPAHKKPVKHAQAKPVSKIKAVAKAKKAAKVLSKKTPAAKTKPKPVAKAAAKKKSSGLLLKNAAAKFKKALSKVTAASSKKAKPAVKTSKASPAKRTTNGKAAAAPAHQSALPKGVLTEAQIRRMSDKDYMNDAQITFFRHRLLQMRAEVLAREVDVKERLHQREIFADPADRATAEEEHWLDLRLRERESLLLRKIDDALRRMADREFGYCEKTGDAIGIPRLLARPTATVCVDVKGQDERIESQFRDR
ncbi:MAG: RNA polymerase-binding protein DksA [Stenotrophobium sp.]